MGIKKNKRETPTRRRFGRKPVEKKETATSAGRTKTWRHSCLYSMKTQMKTGLRVLLLVTLLLALFTPFCMGKTRPDDVIAIMDMFTYFSHPQQLNWSFVDGDPCLDAWTGITCEESTIVSIKLPGLGLFGELGIKMYMLSNLRHMDLSSNKINETIPFGLPHNLTHMNLSGNKLTGNFPSSFHLLVHLQYLDLSFNRFTGDLPISFADLTNLKVLSLQSNQFTGSVTVLANLPLTNLNIQDNQFSGIIPDEFEKILNLRISGNNFETEKTYPPPSSILSPTTIEHPSPHHPATKKEPTTWLIILAVGGCTIVGVGVSWLLLARQMPHPWKTLKKAVELELTSLPL